MVLSFKAASTAIERNVKNLLYLPILHAKNVCSFSFLIRQLSYHYIITITPGIITLY
jgi:hypothetical protein